MNPVLRIKRIYDPPSPGDGARILVDRIWPRGVSRDTAALDGWAKELAPSAELRKWFSHELERWPEFRERYLSELAEQRERAREILDSTRQNTVTLLFAASDVGHNNAVVLREFLDAVDSEESE